MNSLKLPEQFQGPWKHAVILTYGMDIPFFEHALWPQFDSSCRNKVILADGQEYLDACANYAQSGLVRYLNQRYIAEGIFSPRAAHAKLILLVNSQQGRLLVGSGNLGWQGYASGGELFTQYEYSQESPAALAAFLTVRELIEGLKSRGYVSTVAERHLQYLLGDAPWLFRSATSEWRPVRHNFDQSFLAQLKEIIGKEVVQELTIISPFFDKDVVALESMLTTLRPRRAVLLVQRGWTSVDPAALRQTLRRFNQLVVRPFDLRDEDSYVHAKCYLLKLAGRAICLQGSPNLSQVAMLLTDPRGNIELVNLLTGQRNAFDHLLGALEIGPEAKPGELDLSCQSSRMPAYRAADNWYLTGGEWQDRTLHLAFRGKCPDLQGASLVIAGQLFALKVRKREQSLEVELGSEAIELLQRPVPLMIRLGGGENSLVSNPIFVCNRSSLEAELQVAEDTATLIHVRDLELEDEELEQLLAEIEATLVIDRRSVWQIAGRTLPPSDDEVEGDDAPRIDYGDIDYGLLRRHPKIQAYLRRGSGTRTFVSSRLQIILNSITDHFRGLLDITTASQIPEPQTVEVEQDSAQDEEEREEEEQEKARRRQSWARRIQRILKSFIRRYLRGLASPDFQNFVGFEVMAQNYAIFSHVLWRLFAKEWIEPESIIDSLLKICGLFWGNEHRRGYLSTLAREEQTQVLQYIREYHADAQLLASLYYSTVYLRSAYLSYVDNEYFQDAETYQSLQLQLRDFWRSIIVRLPFQVTCEVLEEAWRIVGNLIAYEPPRPVTITDELAALADFDTRENFLRVLADRYGFAAGSCTFARASVRRESFNDPVAVDCLVLNDNAALRDYETAVAVLKDWMRFQKLDYYRVVFPDVNQSDRLIFYDSAQTAGTYFLKNPRCLIDFGSVTPEPSEWDTEIHQLHRLATELDARMTLPQSLAAKAHLVHKN